MAQESFNLGLSHALRTRPGRNLPGAKSNLRQLVRDFPESRYKNQAELLLGMRKHAEAQKVVRELLVLYPEQADPVQTMLLLGQAKLQAGGQSTAEGLALLEKVLAENLGGAWDLELAWPVVATGAVVGLCVALLASAWPAWRSSHTSIVSSLRKVA